MKLQYAFGNPRRKKVAKKRKSKKNRKKVSSKKLSALRKKLRGAIKMAKKRKGQKRNPLTFVATKERPGSKKPYKNKFSVPTKKETKRAIEAKIAAWKKLNKGNDYADQGEAILDEIRKKGLAAHKKQVVAFLKDYKEHQKSGWKIKRMKTESKGETVAKKKPGSKKTGPKKKPGSKKAAAKKAAAKKAAAKKAAAKKAAAKKAAAKKKKAGSRRYPKMITHKHAKSTRHIRKGSSAKISARKRKKSYKVSTYFGKGKKKVKMSGSLRVTKSGLKGRLKINPFRRNPLKNISAQTKTYLGLDVAELGSLAVGGALVPIANGLVGKYVPKVASTIAEYVGPQAAGSVIPILLGVVANAAAEHGVKSGQAHDLLKKAGEGLAAAGIIGLAMSLAQRHLNPMIGLSGINYTPMGIMPTMGDIRYTPSMGDIRYTPSMGIMPQLAGPDFGAADYGGDGGSREAVTQRSDFGAWQSSDSEFDSDEDNSYSSAMN